MINDVAEVKIFSIDGRVSMFDIFLNFWKMKKKSQIGADDLSFFDRGKIRM